MIDSIKESVSSFAEAPICVFEQTEDGQVLNVSFEDALPDHPSEVSLMSICQFLEPGISFGS